MRGMLQEGRSGGEKVVGENELGRKRWGMDSSYQNSFRKARSVTLSNSVTDLRPGVRVHAEMFIDCTRYIYSCPCDYHSYCGLLL